MFKVFLFNYSQKDKSILCYYNIQNYIKIIFKIIFKKLATFNLNFKKTGENCTAQKMLKKRSRPRTFSHEPNIGFPEIPLPLEHQSLTFLFTLSALAGQNHDKRISERITG